MSPALGPAPLGKVYVLIAISPDAQPVSTRRLFLGHPVLLPCLLDGVTRLSSCVSSGLLWVLGSNPGSDTGSMTWDKSPSLFVPQSF